MIGIVADAAHGARALYEAVTRLPLSKAGDATERVAQARAQAARDIAAIEPQMSCLKVIREVMPRDGILVEELCQTGFTSYFGYPVLAPRSYISSGFSGTLGYGFQTALGVKIGNPRKAVVSITGDGGFMFGVQELATAVHHGIGLVTIVFNNASYGNVRRDQQERYGGRVLGSDLTNPDFVKLGEAFGVMARRVTTPAELKGVLEAALGADRPALIEVALRRDSETSPWKFIHFTR
jgi:acetolactate synthase I/II/III large subunit